ncbi:polycystin-2-like protein 1 [Glandiceps talaboti]
MEFDVYNPDSNMFSSITYVVEFVDIGSGECMVQHRSFRLLHKVFGLNTFYDKNAILIFVCWVLFAALAIVLLVSLIRRLIKQRLVFFQLPWNIFDLVLTANTFASLAFMVVYEISGTNTIRNILKNDSGNLQDLAAMSNTLNHILAIDMFFAVLRFLKLMRFNRRMMLLSMTLSEAKCGLISFSIFYLITLFMFSHAAYLYFHTYLDVFKSFSDIISLLFTVSVGKFPSDDSLNVSGQVCTLFLIIYAMLNVTISMSIFIAIINDAFSTAKTANDKEKNHFEMLDYLTARLKDMAINSGLWKPKEEHEERTVEKNFTDIEQRLTKIEKLIDGLDIN